VHCEAFSRAESSQSAEWGEGMEMILFRDKKTCPIYLSGTCALCRLYDWGRGTAGPGTGSGCTGRSVGGA
jgi:hypothetical protein